MNLGQAMGKRRTAVLGLVAVLAIGGAWTSAFLPVAIFPEVTFHRIGIIARAANLPVEQTLTTLTQPLEGALSGVLGVETIRSQTVRGGVELDLRFGWNDDMLRALQLVQSATEEVRGSLPAATEIDTRMLDTSAFPIVGIAVNSASRSLAEISDFAIYEAVPRLRTVPGVYRVELSGAKLREYSLTVDPRALTAHHLALADVESAVRNAAGIVAAGRIEDGRQLALTVVEGEGTEAARLLDIVLASDGGVPITLGQIARVDSALREDFTRAAANGETAVLIGVSRQPAGNALAISAGVRERIAELSRSRPDLQLSVFYDQGDLVHDAVSGVRDAIAIGLVLAIATIFFFISDWRSTLVAAAVIPVTLLVTSIVMRALGMSFNLMTLGGIAAGVGLVLDDAIVVVENFHRHRARGESVDAAIADSTSEIAGALVGSTLTPVAVLLPLGLLGGVPGSFFRPLAITLSVALLASLALAVSFTPSLTAAIEPATARPMRRGAGNLMVDSLAGFYARTLRGALRHPWRSVAVGSVFVVVAWLCYARLETGFVPEMDEGAFILDYWAPPGTSPDETVKLLRPVDEILSGTPEVVAFSRRTGSELGFFLTETNRGDYAVRLKRGKRRASDEIVAEVRAAIRDRAPGLRVEFVQILQDMIGDLSGTPSPIEIKLFGVDQPALEKTAREANAILATIPGVVDNFDGIKPLGPTYRLVVDGQLASRAGVDAAVVQHWLETAVTGTVVGQVLEGDRAIPLRLRYPDEFHQQLDRLRGLDLVGPKGGIVPLRSITRVETGSIAVTRERENLRQLLRVTARLEGRDLGSASAELRRRLAAELHRPAGVTLEYGGVAASQRQAFLELLGVFAAAAVSVGALLLVEFGSMAAVVAIVLGSTLALSGSLASLWVTGTPLNVSSLVGMIMAVGIVSKNGILLLDFALREQAHGSDLESALVEAGRVRLRPILMTSFAALAGLAPLAVGLGAGSQMQQPLAIAILGGLSISMVFSLIAVPLLYSLLTSRSPHTAPAVANDEPRQDATPSNASHPRRARPR